jgi:hypothetical protein
MLSSRRAHTNMDYIYGGSDEDPAGGIPSTWSGMHGFGSGTSSLAGALEMDAFVPNPTLSSNLLEGTDPVTAEPWSSPSPSPNRIQPSVISGLGALYHQEPGPRPEFGSNVDWNIEPDTYSNSELMPDTEYNLYCQATPSPPFLFDAESSRPSPVVSAAYATYHDIAHTFTSEDEDLFPMGQDESSPSAYNPVGSAASVSHLNGVRICDGLTAIWSLQDRAIHHECG